MSRTWNGLELRHLTALDAVAEHGTISRAAEHLGYTQSAVSQQIAALERVVGAPVFDRHGGPRPLTLTEVGVALLDHTRAVLAQLRQAEAEVRSLASGEQGTLRVGTVQSVGTRVLPDVLRRFHHERPGVAVTLRESHDPADLLALVVIGELDVTFCEHPMREGPFACRPVLIDPFVLVAPADSAEAARSAISPAEIAPLPLIGYRNGACLDSQLACFPEGAEPHFVFKSDDNTTIQGCVGAGLGYALVPRLTVDPDDAAVVLIPVEPPPPPRIIALAWSADRREPAALDAFVACVTAACEELGGSQLAA